MQNILTFLSTTEFSQKISVPANTSICNLGDICDSLVILTQGRVKVYRVSTDGRHITLYTIHSGEGCVLTASCLLNDQPFPASAVTEEDCQGYLIPKTVLTSWLETEPQWRAFIFKLLSQRMGELIEKVDQLAFDSLETRLIHWLSSHSQAPCLTITHQQIALELASSREVISRTLKKLEDKGHIELQRGKITLLKPPEAGALT